MRELKFRAYHKERRKYFYFWLMGLDGDYIIGENVWLEDCKPVEQYILLQDRNRVEFFENDIIRDLMGRLDVIVWCIVRAGWMCKKSTEMLADCPVIMWTIVGNIHENPELLEGEG